MLSWTSTPGMIVDTLHKFHSCSLSDCNVASIGANKLQEKYIVSLSLLISSMAFMMAAAFASLVASLCTKPNH